MCREEIFRNLCLIIDLVKKSKTSLEVFLLSRFPTCDTMAVNTHIPTCDLARKISGYAVFSGSYIPVFELNTQIYSVNFSERRTLKQPLEVFYEKRCS